MTHSNGFLPKKQGPKITVSKTLRENR